MLGAEEAGEPDRSHLPAAEWPQEQRLAGGIEAGDDERDDAVLGAGMALPGGQQIEALIGGGPGAVSLERAPERLRRPPIVQHLDPGDAAHAWRGYRQGVLSAGGEGS